MEASPTTPAFEDPYRSSQQKTYIYMKKETTRNKSLVKEAKDIKNSDDWNIAYSSYDKVVDSLMNLSRFWLLNKLYSFIDSIFPVTASILNLCLF